MRSASRNLLIFSKRDPEDSPEYSEFLYLCGNHWPTVTRSGYPRLIRSACDCRGASVADDLVQLTLIDGERAETVSQRAPYSAHEGQQCSAAFDVMARIQRDKRRSGQIP